MHRLYKMPGTRLSANGRRYNIQLAISKSRARLFLTPISKIGQIFRNENWSGSVVKCYFRSLTETLKFAKDWLSKIYHDTGTNTVVEISKFSIEILWIQNAQTNRSEATLINLVTILSHDKLAKVICCFLFFNKNHAFVI